MLRDICERYQPGDWQQTNKATMSLFYHFSYNRMVTKTWKKKRKKRIKAIKNEKHLGREAERSHFLLPSSCIYDLSLVECTNKATMSLFYHFSYNRMVTKTWKKKRKRRIKAIKNEKHLGREAERSHFLLPSSCIYDLSLVECKVPAIIGPVVFRKPLWFTIRKHQHQIGGKEQWKIETCCL